MQRVCPNRMKMRPLLQRRLRSQRGQSTTEFILLSFWFVLFIFVVFQIALFGVQKWYFNFVANYVARSWSVENDANTSIGSYVQIYKVWPLVVAHRDIAGDFLRGGSLIADPVASMIAFNEANRNPPGLRFYGVGRTIGPFDNWIGTRVQDMVPQAAVAVSIAEGFGIEIPSASGYIVFETYIPIRNENITAYGGPQNPNRWDNDCTGSCNNNAR